MADLKVNLNLKAHKENTYDAIVVGSGISGGWAAKELCEKGLKVLMLDKGWNLVHGEYETAFKKPWELKYRGRITDAQRKSHPALSRDTPYAEHNEKYWFNDEDAPYTEVKRFDWYRPNIVGGKSIMWGRQSYRFSEMDFEANAKDGIAVDWPVRYKDIEAWYDYVEQFAGISGQNEGLPQLPDGKFLPPMEMNCLEKHIAAKIKTNFKDRIMTIGRVANLTQNHNGRSACQYRALCNRGCNYGAYFSTQSATLPAATKTGNLTLRPLSIVNQVIYDEKTKKAKGVSVIDVDTKETTEFFAKIIFLNASTIATASLLLNSTSSRFPNGLGNDSDQVGRNLMDHHFRCGAKGSFDGFQDQYYFGRRYNGIYIPRFRNIGKNDREYVRGFGYQGRASRSDWQRGVAEMGVGKDFKESLMEPGNWNFGMTAFGECLPYEENRITLNKEKLDKWGQPTVTFDCEFKENEMKMRKDMKNDGAEMLEMAGLKNVETFDMGAFPGMGIHEMGTVRMGKDPKTSVLNGFNQMHDVKNVFVSDGSFMVSSGCQNPSLSYMAFTARACDYAVKEMKKGNI